MRPIQVVEQGHAGLQGRFAFIKPVQTGFPEDSDARLVAQVAKCHHLVGSHAAFCDSDIPLVDTSQPALGASDAAHRGSAAHSGGDAAEVWRRAGSFAQTLYAWQAAMSPHRAVQREGRLVSDAQLRDATVEALRSAETRLLHHEEDGAAPLALVETAGGVCSPAPFGSLQVLCKQPF